MSYKPLKYKCPSCKNETLVLDSVGLIICSLIGCKEPDAMHNKILGLGAEKDQCCLPHEPCERCGKEPTPEPRTWPCEHVITSPDGEFWINTPGWVSSYPLKNEWNYCPVCGAKRPEKIWCAHIKLKGDTWHFEYVDQQDPLISHQVTIEDWEKFCRACGKERPR